MPIYADNAYFTIIQKNEVKGEKDTITQKIQWKKMYHNEDV